MGKFCRLGLALLLFILFSLQSSDAFGVGPVKVSIFNFATATLEASGYGTSVTNMLANYLKADPGLALLDRRELEAFLNLNDLQQNDNLENVAAIGNRLG